MLAHFIIGDQFMGFSGSPVSGSTHHTTSSDGEAGVVGEAVAVGIGLLENGSGFCEGAIWYRCATRNQTSPLQRMKTGYRKDPKSTGGSERTVKPSSGTSLASHQSTNRLGQRLPRYLVLQ